LIGTLLNIFHNEMLQVTMTGTPIGLFNQRRQSGSKSAGGREFGRRQKF